MDANIILRKFGQNHVNIFKIYQTTTKGKKISHGHPVLVVNHQNHGMDIPISIRTKKNPKNCRLFAQWPKENIHPKNKIDDWNHIKVRTPSNLPGTSTGRIHIIHKTRLQHPNKNRGTN